MAARDLLTNLDGVSGVVGDRGYAADALITFTEAQSLYAKRSVVERYFNRIKHFRRMGARYDKLARNSVAAVALVSARLRLRTFKSRT